MEAAVLLLVGAIGLLFGFRLILRSRASRSRWPAAGGLVLMLIGLWLIVGGVWASGELVETSDSDLKPPVGLTSTNPSG